MTRIWQLCNGDSHKKKLNIQGWRIVEDQTQSFTRGLVDSDKEHTILENILEKNKPKIPFYNDENAFQNLHYLLFTPFRYPPLKYGTRFGSLLDRNLFYASVEINTALAEKAFHLLKFLLSSSGNIGNKSIPYTTFRVDFKINPGIDLSEKPFIKYRSQISSPTSYQDSQILGKCMRDAGVAACISFSARCKNNGKNINVFSPTAFDKNSDLEKTFKSISCYQSKKTIEYSFDQKQSSNPIIFKVEDFFVDGQFPMPI